jgi:dTDP-4-dehydrorhamnose reductase
MNAKHEIIAVTGANGQLGGELCRQLGDHAVPLDIDTLDLTDRQAVLDKLLEIQPTLIINCAAYTKVDQAESEPEVAWAVNVGAVENLVAACRRLDCPLVQISTDYVFGEGGRGKAEGGSTRPWAEEDEPSPQGVYARTKLDGEWAAAKWEKHLIVRTCGLYARPSDVSSKNFVKTILRLADTQPELRVVNDQHCTPSYVPHVVGAVLFLIKAGATGIFHVTNRGETTWYDFAAEILRLAGKNVPLVPISTAEFAAPAPRPRYSVLDTTKYNSLGRPEMPDWRNGLKEYFEECRVGQAQRSPTSR